MAIGFKKWRNVFLKKVRKNELQELSSGYMRQLYIKKYFSTMINMFYSVQGLENTLKDYR
jgi:hypothetical protein